MQEYYKQYKDLQYNAYNVLKDHYPDYEYIGMIPLKDLIQEVDFFTPKLKQIADMRAQQAMEKELMGKTGKKPNIMG